MKLSAMRLLPIALLFTLLLVPQLSYAYFNVTRLITTVYLGNSTSAQVSETIDVFVSNSSINQYIRDRSAVNQTLSNWQAVLNTHLLIEHIFNAKYSIKNFTLLPGPISMQGNNATAYLTMEYTALNVTNIKEIAPRKFEYTFNDSAFNFEHTASGQQLFQNATLIFVIPKGAKVVMPIYPLPDYPTGNYENATKFSWFEAEPLNDFSFSYIITESLQQEVINFFANAYTEHTLYFYLTIAVILVLIAAYAYTKIRK